MIAKYCHKLHKCGFVKLRLKCGITLGKLPVGSLHTGDKRSGHITKSTVGPISVWCHLVAVVHNSLAMSGVGNSGQAQ
jgi:hypothetical protein